MKDVNEFREICQAKSKEALDMLLKIVGAPDTDPKIKFQGLKFILEQAYRINEK